MSDKAPDIEFSARVHDETGYVSVGPDADGLGLCQIEMFEFIAGERRRVGGFCLGWREARGLSQAIIDLDRLNAERDD